MSVTDSETTLHDAREYLIAHAKGPNGTKCPVCRQKVKVSRHRISRSWAKALIAFRDSHGDEWGHAPSTPFGPRWSEERGTLAKLGGDWALMRHWGLIEKSTERQGWWRLTDLGIRYLDGATAVPLIALTCKPGVLGFIGGEGTISDALGHTFHYSR